MTKPWDDVMKHMAHLNPNSLLQWLLPGALFLEELPLELNLRAFDVDLLLKIRWGEQEMLLHVEFQTRNDASMAKRMVRYNVLAHCEHKLPVLSLVIYLFPNGEIPASPLCWFVPTGHQTLEFRFLSIKLNEIKASELLKLDHVGLLPLLPLTLDGARREPIQQMLTALEAFGDTELLSLGYTFANLVLQKLNQADLEWLKRSYAHMEMEERLQESPFVQFLQERAGIKEARGSILKIVDAKYPQTDLLPLIRGLVVQTENHDVLQDLMIQMSLASTFEDAHSALLIWAKSNNLQQH